MELLNHTEQKNNEGDIVSVIRMFGEFNSKIYGASRMKRLAVMIEKLNEYIQRFRNISISEDCRKEEALKEHREILRAVAEKDRENIDEIIKKHLHDSFEIVITEIM